MNYRGNYIEKEKLTPNPLNTFPIGDLTDLKNTIEELGILSPLSVVGPFNDGSYRIIAGHRRFQAFCELYKEGRIKGKIPYHVVGDKNMSDREQFLRILISNIEAREENTSNIYKAELIEVLKKMAEEGMIKEREIAARMAGYMKTSVRYARYWTRVFATDNEDIKDLVKENKLSIKNADKIISIEDEQAKKAAIDAVKRGNPIPANVFRGKKSDTKKNLQEENFRDGVSDLQDEEEEGDLEEAFDKKKVEDPDMTSNDLDDMDFSLDDLKGSLDLSVARDTTGLLTGLLNDTQKSSTRKNTEEDVAGIVISWCESMKDVTEPTAEEWNAINACIEIAERFG